MADDTSELVFLTVCMGGEAPRFNSGMKEHGVDGEGLPQNYNFSEESSSPNETADSLILPYPCPAIHYVDDANDGE